MLKLKEDIKEFKIPIIIVLLYCLFMQLVFKGMCPIRVFFHHDCPGCGLTRAFVSLLKGNISLSLHYNYSLIFWLITFITFVIDRYIKPLKIKPIIFLILAFIIMMIRYILIYKFNIYLF